MSKLNVKAKVMYMPGPWGANEPVKGAAVKIIDVDVGGKDDVILTKTTNSQGKLQGTSKDWQDPKRIRTWEPLPLPGRWVTKTMPDPTDMMLLEIDIKEGCHHVRAPFVYLGPQVEVPIIVPWGKQSLGDVVSSLVPSITVNKKKFTDPMAAQKEARKYFEASEPKVTIELQGPEALAFVPFAGKNLDELKECIDDILPGASQFFYSNPIGAAELSAIALIILASGAVLSGTLLAGCIGFSLILALYLGYGKIDIKMKAGSDSNPMPSVEFTLAK